MSSMLRMSFIHKGMCLYASNLNVLKTTFNIPFTAISRCKNKTLDNFLPVIQRNYAVSTNIKPIESEVSEDTNQNIQIGINSNNNERELIYKGLLNKHVKYMKILSLSTSSTVIMLTPYVYYQTISNPEMPNAAAAITFSLLVYAILSPIILHLITKRYVNVIEYLPKENEYIARIYNFFAIQKEIKFNPSDITIPTMRDPFANCAIKKKNVFFDPKQFTDQIHYIKIMGYDKPFEVMSDDIVSKKDK